MPEDIDEAGEDVDNLEEAVTEPTPGEELEQMVEFRNAVYKATGQLAQAAQEPLTFRTYGWQGAVEQRSGKDRRVEKDRRDHWVDYPGPERRDEDKYDRREEDRRHCEYSGPPYGVVETGILWIPPFVSTDWIIPPKRAIKPKCVCPACGSKHAKKGG